MSRPLKFPASLYHPDYIPPPEHRFRLRLPPGRCIQPFLSRTLVVIGLIALETALPAAVPLALSVPARCCCSNVFPFARARIVAAPSSISHPVQECCLRTQRLVDHRIHRRLRSVRHEISPLLPPRTASICSLIDNALSLQICILRQIARGLPGLFLVLVNVLENSSPLLRLVQDSLLIFQCCPSNMFPGLSLFSSSME